MTSHDPLTRGSAVTILPGVPLEAVPAQRTEATPLEQAAPTETPIPSVPQQAQPPAGLPWEQPVAGHQAPAAPSQAAAPMAPVPPQSLVPPAAPAPVFAAPAQPAAPPAPVFAAPAQPAAADPFASGSGPSGYPTAPVFDADIPAAPAAFPADIPAAQPFAPAPAPAPVAGIPAQPTGFSTPVGEQPAVPLVPLAPPAEAVSSPAGDGLQAPVAHPIPVIAGIGDDADAKPGTIGRIGKRRRESTGSGQSVRIAAATAVVLGAAAGWFGHGALSSSTTTETLAPVIQHATTKPVVPLGSVAALDTLHVLPKPWVSTAQQALLTRSVTSSGTPVYFGAGGSHGTYAEVGVTVGTLSASAASAGVTFPAGPGGGTVRCGTSPTGGQLTGWCTWKDGRSSGMVAAFAGPTAANAYRWTQLVRQTLEP